MIRSRSSVTYCQVTRRIIRHHKRLFRDDVEQLCMFIADSCEAINCMLSESYRREKAGVQNELAAKTALEEDEEEGDSKKNVLALEEKSLERRESGASPSAGGAVGESMHSRERWVIRSVLAIVCLIVDALLHGVFLVCLCCVDVLDGVCMYVCVDLQSSLYRVF